MREFNSLVRLWQNAMQAGRAKPACLSSGPKSLDRTAGNRETLSKAHIFTQPNGVLATEAKPRGRSREEMAVTEDTATTVAAGRCTVASDYRKTLLNLKELRVGTGKGARSPFHSVRIRDVFWW
jgi:hypothetical protein